LFCACASGSAAHRVYRTRCKIEGQLPAGLNVPARPLAIAHEVIEQSFRNASIDGGDVIGHKQT